MSGREVSIPAFTISQQCVSLSHFHLKGCRHTRDAAKLKGPARIRILPEMMGVRFKSKGPKEGDVHSYPRTDCQRRRTEKSLRRAYHWIDGNWLPLLQLR